MSWGPLANARKAPDNRENLLERLLEVRRELRRKAERRLVNLRNFFSANLAGLVIYCWGQRAA